MVFHQAYGPGREIVLADGFPARRHYLADGSVVDIDAPVQRPAQVAVGEHAAKLAAAVHHGRDAEIPAGHFQEAVAHGCLRRHAGDVAALVHDVLHAHQQPPAQHAAGMKIGEVLFPEPPLFQQDDGQRIAHGQRRGGACGGCEIEGTGFFGHADVQVHRSRPGQGGPGVPRHGDQRQSEPLDPRQQEGDFLGFPGIGNRQNHILARDHAHVAMPGFTGMHEKRRRSGARQGGGDLAAHVPGLAQTDDHYSGLFALRLDAYLARSREFVAQPRDQCANGVGLDLQHPARRDQRVDSVGGRGHGA